MTKIIALIDGVWTGHHPTYVKLLTETILELGYNVVVFCPNPVEVGDWITENCGEMAGRFCPYEYTEPICQPFLPGVVKTTRQWKAAALAIKKAAANTGILPDLVFFTYLDGYFAKHLKPWIVDAVFPYVWSGLYFAPERLRVPTPVRDAPLFSSGCKSVALLDEGVKETLERELAKPVISFPDFADLSAPDMNYPVVGQIKERARGRKIVGLFGCIDKRKGTLMLVEVAKKLVDEGLFFVFAGVFYKYTFTRKELDHIENFIASCPSNCFFHLGFIPDEPSFNALVCASDIVFAAYQKFYHSSNLLTKAASFKKAIIVSDGFCMAERVRKFRLGKVIKQDDVDACIRAIRQLATGMADDESIGPDYEGYMRNHSKERLKDSCSLLLKLSLV
ncbi:glycosyltransferase family protein [Geotalea uraniireducens]|uniref:Glycosyltransferase n=1 Tax=Geotalea uraniireducens (strain Rf4) TaxID=351605 RepID=A5G816_GEOUR|nr:hypothetical protein [Geotalea uraniireducens]ABQ27934.1 hypothetical protein Gura_3783 [Geotalea uraniireducens Rf4]